MRRFPFTIDNWHERQGPRRFEFSAMDVHALHNAATVSVWESKYDDDVLQAADVIVMLTPHGVMVESSYKFDGEVRTSY